MSEDKSPENQHPKLEELKSKVAKGDNPEFQNVESQTAISQLENTFFNLAISFNSDPSRVEYQRLIDEDIDRLKGFREDLISGKFSHPLFLKPAEPYTKDAPDERLVEFSLFTFGHPYYDPERKILTTRTLQAMGVELPQETLDQMIEKSSINEQTSETPPTSRWTFKTKIPGVAVHIYHVNRTGATRLALGFKQQALIETIEKS